MGTVRRVRRAWGRGGPREVVLASRRWLARLIYPGDIPAPKRRRRHRAVPATGPSAALDARDVEHAQAMEWFGRRHATYVRLSEAVRDYVDPEGTIIDVGANIGYFTKVLGETLDFRGTAHLFEPLEHLASLCDQTLARAPYTVHVHPYALGDTDTKLDIFVDTSGGNLGWNTLVAERATAGMLATTIDVKPFTATAIERAPCFLKIDVEGAEHLVIAGMADALASWD
ncbi:FkbM family methyltransferase, partial [Mumia sp.]|uniref:FkbM family methyltransferase n=1 Tax=Mumia sp. TaxID=1965300 RepID=UPI00262B5A78